MKDDKEGDSVGRLKKKHIRNLVFVGLVLLAVFCLASWFVSELPYRDLTAEEVVNLGIGKIELGKSYSFTLNAKEFKKDQEKQLASLSGDVYQGDARVSGSLPFINAEIDLVRLGNVLYRKDSITDRWVQIPVSGLKNVEEFMMEINPLGAFEFLDSMEATYVGKEKVDGRRCRVYEVMTKGEHEWMTYFWQDYNYRIWIDQKEGYMKKGEVAAEHRDDSTHTLHVVVMITDFGKKINIEAPVKDAQ
jgi:hypothetical protein